MTDGPDDRKNRPNDMSVGDGRKDTRSSESEKSAERSALSRHLKMLRELKSPNR
jgi:hypothetical protein